MQYLNHTTIRDEIITNVLHSLKRTFYNYALAFRTDVDDLMQEAVIIMLETWDKIPQGANYAAYLHVVVRNRVNDRFPQDDTLSLDAPITESGITLGDTIAAPYTPQINYTYIDYVTRVVHCSLQQLPPEIQMYAVETFGMGGYHYKNCSKKLREYVISVYKRRSKADMKKELKKAFECNTAVLDLFTRKRRGYNRVK